MLTRKSLATSIVIGAACVAGLATSSLSQDVPYWVRIEAGTFQMGSHKTVDPLTEQDERPPHAVTLDAFEIGRFEVTVGEFAEFVAAGGYSNEAFRPLWDLSEYGERNFFGAWDAPANWSYQSVYSNWPVTGVTWHEAMVYCRWRTRRDGQRVTLPTEAQWERAARGTEARRFAWGDQIPDGTVSLNYDRRIGHPSDVGSHPEGDTPGANPISDLAGNAWELCLDRKVSYYHTPRVGDGLRDGRSEFRVIRGGSFDHAGKEMRAARRGGASPKVRSELVGFRLVRPVVAR